MIELPENTIRVKVELKDVVHEVHIQSFDGKIILHHGEIHVADVELKAALVKLEAKL